MDEVMCKRCQSADHVRNGIVRGFRQRKGRRSFIMAPIQDAVFALGEALCKPMNGHGCVGVVDLYLVRAKTRKIAVAKLQRLSHFHRFGFPDFRVNRV